MSTIDLNPEQILDFHDTLEAAREALEGSKLKEADGLIFSVTSELSDLLEAFEEETGIIVD